MSNPAANRNHFRNHGFHPEHPGFIHRSSALYFIRVSEKTRDSKPVLDLWDEAFRSILPVKGFVTFRRKIKTPDSENHKALVLTAIKEDPAGLDEPEGKVFFALEPRRAILETTTTPDEQKRVWDTNFERRFKENMIANRKTVLPRSMYCALAAGVRVMLYYFDASKEDGDEGQFERLHEEPFDLRVLADQIEVERRIRLIAEQARDTSR